MTNTARPQASKCLKLCIVIHLSILLMPLKQPHIIPEAHIKYMAPSQVTALKAVIQNYHLAVNDLENIAATNLEADVVLIRDILKRNQDRQVCELTACHDGCNQHSDLKSFTFQV